MLTYYYIILFTSRRNNPLTTLHLLLFSPNWVILSFYLTIVDTLSVSKKNSRQGNKTDDRIVIYNGQQILLSREELVNIKTAFHKIAGKKVVSIFDYDFTRFMHLEPDFFTL